MVNSMYEEYNFFLNKLNGIFETEYIKAYKKIKGANKRKINSYLSDIYRKWYFSTLFEGSALSPANIIANLKAIYAIPPDIHDNISLVKPTVQKNSFSYIRAHYAGPDFPIISDLKLLVDRCAPLLALTEFGKLTEETKAQLQAELLIYDNYYIDYLLELAYELKICEEAPSIHMRAAQQTKRARTFFKADKKAVFSEIFNAASTIFTAFLNLTLPFGDHNKEFVTAALTQTLSTDQIYQKLYALNGVDFNMIWDETIDDSVFPPEVKEYLSLGVYYLGIGIDKYFFTPMGYYLKIIEPFYMLPTHVDEDVAILYNAIRDKKEVEAEIYAPCSEYYLTKFGADFLGIQNNKPAPEILAPGNKGEIRKLILSLSEVNAVANNRNMKSVFKIRTGDDRITVYQLKITLLTNKRFWLVIEVSQAMTFSDLHTQICYALDFDVYANYSFFIGLEESPFMQITPAYHKRRTKKAEETKLSDCQTEEEGELVLKYVTENTTSVFSELFADRVAKFEILLTKIKPDEYSLLFPRVYRRSKLFTDYLDTNDLMY